MAVAANNSLILGDAVLNYTVPAGSDRLVVIGVAFWASSGTPDIQTCELGAQSATALTPSLNSLSSNKICSTRVFYIKEADIPAGSNAVTFDVDGVSENLTGNSRDIVFITTLTGVDQNSSYFYETPVIVNNTQSLNAKNLVVSFGNNQNKFGLTFCVVRSGDYAFEDNSGTIVANKGTSLATELEGGTALNWMHGAMSKIDSLATNGEQLTWTVDYPDSGTSFEGHRVVVAYAMVFDEAGVATTITLDQAQLEPGGTISGSYQGFQAGTPPTSPISISDGVNSVTAAVTINDNGDGTGTFSGTLPSLPAAGNSGSFVLFGNVTATLDDA